MKSRLFPLAPLWLALALGGRAPGQEAPLETFDADPRWDGFRNRLVPDPPQVTRQSFGYRPSHHARGAGPGEMGGLIQRSTTPAWYAKPIQPVSLQHRLSASGRLALTRADGGSSLLFGWFNARSRGWRMPNSLVLRLDGNGGRYWVFFEYGTRHWLTGGGATFQGEYQTTTDKPLPSDGTPHDWRLEYRPKDGAGELELVFDGRSFVVPVPAEHVEDGAEFDRFGMVNLQLTGDVMEAWIDDLQLGGEHFAFDRDPGWEGRGNEAAFPDRVRRPFHDVGFSPTSHAGGAPGEMGGIIWRDERPAYYAAPVEPLTLQDELFASGTLAFLGAGSDSAVCLGFFDAASKRAKTASDREAAPANLLAILLEGPSRVGHYFRGGYRNRAGEGVYEDSGPVLQPDGQVHRWSLRYTPKAPGGGGEIAVTLDGKTQTTRVAQEHQAAGARFDRFGIFNLQAGGHYVELYVDELRFTRGPAKP